MIHSFLGSTDIIVVDRCPQPSPMFSQAKSPRYSHENTPRCVVSATRHRSFGAKAGVSVPQRDLYAPSITDHFAKDIVASSPVTPARCADAGPTWIRALHLFEEKLLHKSIETVGFVALHPVSAARENVQFGVGQLLQQ